MANGENSETLLTAEGAEKGGQATLRKMVGRGTADSSWLAWLARRNDKMRVRVGRRAQSPMHPGPREVHEQHEVSKKEAFNRKER